MDEELKKLAEAPLANACKLNLPKGRLPPKREEPQDLPREPRAAIKARHEAAHTAKKNQLLDYYATVDVPAERVAEHVGLWRKEEYKPDGWKEGDRLAVRKVLDVERAAAELKWRREHRV